MNLTAHFTKEELIHSDTAIRKGIDNEPDHDTLDNLTMAAGGLERVRTALNGVPIHVSSGYRSPKLNAAVGGSATSAHVKGLAIDFTAPLFGTPKEIAVRIAANKETIGFEQLIYEGTWVHISFPPFPAEAKGEILTAHFANGGVSYTRGLA